jgi:predicted TPR repeat methyltransferase
MLVEVSGSFNGRVFHMTEQERQQIEEIIASLKPSALKYETGRAEKSGMSLYYWIAEKEQKKSAAKDKLNTLESQLASKTQIKNINSAHAHYNLGVTHKELGRLDEAEASYTQAVALKPDFVEAHYNLGNTLRELGRLDEAEASYKQAIALKLDYAEAHNNLGVTLQELGRLDEAEASYKQAIALKPNYAEAHSNLGNTLRELGRLDEAEASCRQAIALKPDYAKAEHILAALTGETTATAPLDYVEGLFDNYAAKFENSLVDNLEYKIPKVIAEIIIKDSKFDLLGPIMDLGCGTGLFGMEIKQFCEHLEGIDLSEKMLNEAKKKNIYNKLTKEDILAYLSNESLNFDYFVSTDVFIYIGDLSDIFRLIKSRNKTGGKLAFSTEDYDGDDFFLEKSGRYSHSKNYIDDLCEKFGYKLRHFETQALRKDKNEYISGGLYLLDF